MPLSQSTFVWGLLMRLLKQNRFFPLYFSKRTSGRKRFRIVPLLLRASSSVKKRCLPEPSMPKALWTFSSIIPGILSQGISCSDALLPSGGSWAGLHALPHTRPHTGACSLWPQRHWLVSDLPVEGPIQSRTISLRWYLLGLSALSVPHFFFFSYLWLLNLKFLHSFCHRIRFGLIYVYHFRSSCDLGFFLSCGNPNCSICFLKRGLGCWTAVLPSWSCSLEDF